jgi:hypothetical protein
MKNKTNNILCKCVPLPVSELVKALEFLSKQQLARLKKAKLI